jgi:hypothetical protein
MKKFIAVIREYYLRFAVSTLLLIPRWSFGDDGDPFPVVDGDKSGDVIKTAGGKMESAVRYTLIGAGSILIIICLAVIVHRLREDNREKDHGNLVITFILVALGLTFGFILIDIGWSAASYQPT